MSPIVFVLGITSWLAAVPVHNSPADWNSPAPIPPAPAKVSPDYDRVMVRAVTGGQLQVKNRQDFEQKMLGYLHGLAQKKQPEPALVWERQMSSHAAGHLAYCGSFVRSAYAMCGIWIPSTSLKGLQNYGTVLPKGKPPAVGDLLFLSQPGSDSPSHVALYMGDGRLMHPGSPAFTGRLSDLPADGYHVAFIKRIVSAWTS